MSNILQQKDSRHKDIAENNLYKVTHKKQNLRSLLAIYV